MFVELSDRWRFFRQFLADPVRTGAVIPTSAALAERVAKTLDGSAPGKRAVLEIGPGMGAVTRFLLDHLTAGDQLVLVEMNDRFAAFLTEKWGRPAANAPIVRVDRADFNLWESDRTFDVVVSSLPLQNFSPADRRRLMARMMTSLSPGGTLVFYRYLVGLHDTNEWHAFIDQALDDAVIRTSLLEMELVLWNLPPAQVIRLQVGAR